MVLCATEQVHSGAGRHHSKIVSPVHYGHEPNLISLDSRRGLQECVIIIKQRY